MDILTGQQLLKKTGEVVNANEALKDKKIICYYFSAHWCPPCRNFTPILQDFYNVSTKVLLRIVNFLLPEMVVNLDYVAL